jgi:YHS domain-containing protein
MSSVATAAGKAATAVALPRVPELPAVSEAVILHDAAGIAILGYDPVAYFAEGRAIGGSKLHEVQHRGYVWRFATSANLAAFRADPEAYTPAFGGHDAVAIARGRAVDTEPRHFVIREGQLYLFRNGESKAAFLSDAAVAAEAHARWGEVERQLAR